MERIAAQYYLSEFAFPYIGRNQFKTLLPQESGDQNAMDIMYDRTFDALHRLRDHFDATEDVEEKRRLETQMTQCIIRFAVLFPCDTSAFKNRLRELVEQSKIMWGLPDWYVTTVHTGIGHPSAHFVFFALRQMQAGYRLFRLKNIRINKRRNYAYFSAPFLFFLPLRKDKNRCRYRSCFEVKGQGGALSLLAPATGCLR